MMKNCFTPLYIAQAGVIAAIYVVLTWVASLLGIANYAIQIRLSEALTILPLLTPAAIPGLYLGCIIANFSTGCHIIDVIFGSFATLIGAFGTYFIGKFFQKQENRTTMSLNIERILGAIPPIVANVIVVPPILAFVYHLEGTIPFFMLTVGIGEIISCGVLGFLLHAAIYPHRQFLFRN